MLKTNGRRKAYTSATTHAQAFEAQEYYQQDRLRRKRETQEEAHFENFNRATLWALENFTSMHGQRLTQTIQAKTVVSFYEILGIEQTATQEQIQSRYNLLTSNVVTPAVRVNKCVHIKSNPDPKKIMD